tara:strand:+ start:387 stop:755 length:369 start_codon:yes stop_codon:yes gene_type:complete
MAKTTKTTARDHVLALIQQCLAQGQPFPLLPKATRMLDMPMGTLSATMSNLKADSGWGFDLVSGVGYSITPPKRAKIRRHRQRRSATLLDTRHLNPKHEYNLVLQLLQALALGAIAVKIWVM